MMYKGLLRHRGEGYYARLYLGGKEKWLSLATPALAIPKAKMPMPTFIFAPIIKR
jgi:hypothetical protein